MELFIEKNVIFSKRENLVITCLQNLFEKTTEITFVQPYPNGFTFYNNEGLNKPYVKIGNLTLNNIQTKKINLNSLAEYVIVYGSEKRFKKVLKNEGLKYLVYVPYIENDLNDVIKYCDSKKIPYTLN